MAAEPNNPTARVVRNQPMYQLLWRLKWLMDHINQKSSQLYIPETEVAIDEVMVPFKGRVHFKQYIKMKPHKWGMKLWALAESKLGYICQVQVYCGRPIDPSMAWQGQGQGQGQGCVMLATTCTWTAITHPLLSS